MVQKRGQVTVFIVVGIIILLISALTFFIVNKIQKDDVSEEAYQVPAAAHLKPRVSGFVEGCLENSALVGLFLLGKQGGRIYVDPDETLITQEETVAFHYLDGKKIITESIIQDDLNTFIEQYIDECLDNFESLEQQGIRVSAKEKKVSSIINIDGVEIYLDYPLRVSSRESDLTLEKFNAIVPIRLGHILDIGQRIVDGHVKEPFINDLPAYVKEDAQIVVFPFDEETTIFSIYDEKSVIQGLPYHYWFALRDTTANIPPVLDVIPGFVAQQGVIFKRTIDAYDLDNDALVFTSSSSQFPISEDGVVEFIPKSVGKYNVEITVEDARGGKDSAKFKFTVEAPPE